LYGTMFGHPGTNLLFMGAEFGQSGEWNFQQSLDWHETENPWHSGIQTWVKALNHLYKTEAAMYEKQFHAEGFHWISYNDSDNCVLAFIRKGDKPKNDLVFVCNFTPVVRENYQIGMPKHGTWTEILNSDSTAFGGSGVLNDQDLQTVKEPFHNFNQSISLTLAPLAVSVLRVKG